MKLIGTKLRKLVVINSRKWSPTPQSLRRPQFKRRFPTFVRLLYSKHFASLDFSIPRTIQDEFNIIVFIHHTSSHLVFFKHALIRYIPRSSNMQIITVTVSKENVKFYLSLNVPIKIGIRDVF